MKSSTPKTRGWRGWLYTVHLWVGIVVAVQLLLWTASGLLMTANPIATVRGEHLRRTVQPVDLRDVGAVVPPAAAMTGRTDAIELSTLLGRPVWRVTAGPAKWLVDARTGRRWTLSAGDAVAVVRAATVLRGAPSVTRVTDPPPLELRRPGGAWRVAWPDGTHVYVGTAGEILGLRTNTWRWHDLAWGLHILDPVEREDTHHPLLIASAVLALVSVISGIVLIVVHFRRRRA